ncbi:MULTISPECIES: NUDIX domain-containing protein [unclassified Ruegeria]|uniref:NUDIX domain-containing protein n=1 Tax=unclassified Ruegeria TaxID=2625375 RepID=UPI00148885DF|nr:MULTISPECIES: NUDIX domain-containing protein [unclassified Ruegeria]NOD63528.1 NUDIX domain-containing protein [Ruegeria sp. HKCCD6109]
MPNLFFYGTLRYLPLLERVLGRSLQEISVQTAMLPDHAVWAVQGQDFPMIQTSRGDSAQGVFVQDLSSKDLARLAFYEGAFDYDLTPVKVVLHDGTKQEAQVFFPAPGSWEPDGPWSLQRWVDRLGEITALAAEEEMAYFGRLEPQDMAGNIRAIQTRAWAKILAGKRRTGDLRDTRKDVIVHRHNRAYVNYFGMEEVDLQHRQHDGTMGPVLQRGSLMQGSAVSVLPYDPVRDTVLVVEQFRPPAFLINDPEPWLWEAVAGMIDPGEEPEQAAHREAMEEAGVTFDRLEYAGGAYSSSGSSTGFMYLFVGLGDLTHTTTTGGLDTEGEDIRSQILPFDTFIEMTDRHVFKDVQLVALAYWLARHRDRLRA